MALVPEQGWNLKALNVLFDLPERKVVWAWGYVECERARLPPFEQCRPNTASTPGAS